MSHLQSVLVVYCPAPPPLSYLSPGMSSARITPVPTELTMKKDLEQTTDVKAAMYSRRPDIDLIRIVLTWAVLLYHTVLIYAPILPYYVKIYSQTIEGWHWSSLWFLISNNVWHMPMFFFLSGIRKDHSRVINILIITINFKPTLGLSSNRDTNRGYGNSELLKVR